MSYKLHLYDSTQIFNKFKKNSAWPGLFSKLKYFLSILNFITAFEVSANVGNNFTKND